MQEARVSAGSSTSHLQVPRENLHLAVGHCAQVCYPKTGTDQGTTSTRQRGKQCNKPVHQFWLSVTAADKAQEAVK